MNAEKNYRKHEEEGPDSLSLQDNLAALEWRDSHPAEALRIRRQLEREHREAEDEATARDLWRMRGGDERSFSAAYKELSDERRKEEIAAVDREAREASARATWRGF